MRVTKLRRLHFVHRRILDSNIVHTNCLRPRWQSHFFLRILWKWHGHEHVCAVYNCWFEKHFCCMLQMLRFTYVCSKREPSYRLLLFCGPKGIAPAFSLAYDRQHEYLTYKLVFVNAFAIENKTQHITKSFTTIFGAFFCSMHRFVFCALEK